MQIACLRSLGLAARYVSGYLRTYPPPGKPRLVGADASHAWVSAYCKGSGWIDLDPTNNVVPSDGHATIAWGRDYGDVSPLRGLIMGGRDHSLEVAVDMEPIEVAAPLKPRKGKGFGFPKMTLARRAMSAANALYKGGALLFFCQLTRYRFKLDKLQQLYESRAFPYFTGPHSTLNPLKWPDIVAGVALISHRDRRAT